jgi:hypothetical protein
VCGLELPMALQNRLSESATSTMEGIINLITTSLSIFLIFVLVIGSFVLYWEFSYIVFWWFELYKESLVLRRSMLLLSTSHDSNLELFRTIIPSVLLLLAIPSFRLIYLNWRSSSPIVLLRLLDINVLVCWIVILFLIIIMIWSYLRGFYVKEDSDY